MNSLDKEADSIFSNIIKLFEICEYFDANSNRFRKKLLTKNIQEKFNLDIVEAKEILAFLYMDRNQTKGERDVF